MDKDLLYRFFDGRTSVEEMQEIKEWSEASEENREQLLRERKLFDAMLLTGNLKRKPEVIGKIKPNYFMKELLKIASVVLITVCMTASMFMLFDNRHDRQTAMNTITVPAGQRVNIDLPDGTNVWLNAGTSLKYATSFLSGKTREVILDGEAYFDVVHNEKAPFVVHTYAMDVEVLGTKFNVEAYAGRKVFETSLMQGRVKVFQPQKKEAGVILQPSYKTTLVDGKLIVSKIDDFNEYRWKDGFICFRHKSFAYIMKEFEKYYDLKIVVDNKNIGEIELTGKFRIADGLDYALRVLQNDVDFTYHRDKDNDVIYIK